MALFFSFFISALIVLCFQTTVLDQIFLPSIKPDLIIIMVAYLGIFQSPVTGVLLAFTLGLLMDTLSGGVIGLYALLRIITFILTKLTSKNFYLRGVLPQIILLTVLSVIDGVLMLSILYIFSSINNLWPFILKHLPLQSISTGILSPVIIFLLNKTNLSPEPH